jgi:hypothetical protein
MKSKKLSPASFFFFFDQTKGALYGCIQALEEREAMVSPPKPSFHIKTICCIFFPFDLYLSALLRFLHLLKMLLSF